MKSEKTCEFKLCVSVETVQSRTKSVHFFNSVHFLWEILKIWYYRYWLYNSTPVPYQSTVNFDSSSAALTAAVSKKWQRTAEHAESDKFKIRTKMVEKSWVPSADGTVLVLYVNLFTKTFPLPIFNFFLSQKWNWVWCIHYYPILI